MNPSQNTSRKQGKQVNSHGLGVARPCL